MLQHNMNTVFALAVGEDQQVQKIVHYFLMIGPLIIIVWSKNKFIIIFVQDYIPILFEYTQHCIF